MNRLWAPWRMDYISGEKDEGCIFCKAPELPPEDSLLLFSGSVSLVMLNKYPYNNGHLMIAPTRHVAAVEDLTPEESIDLFRLLRHSTTVLKNSMNTDGLNVGMNLGKAAGAGVEAHLHMHVVPRWNGDVNFMPVVAETKVMPEHLAETLEKLKPLFDRV